MPFIHTVFFAFFGFVKFVYF